MALDGVKNFAIVTVSTGYDNDDTSIVLETGDGAKLPDPATANFNLVWWDSTNYSEPALDPNVEIVRCTAKSTDTLTVTRAQESTSGSTKNTVAATYKMALTVTAKMITDIGTALDGKKADSVSATSRVLGRKTAGSGVIEELTLSEVMDFIGSATAGDILYRGASSWARLPKGTDGQVLTLASGLPSWANASGGGSLLAVKTANESVANSTTYQDDDHLSLSVEENSNYLVELNLALYPSQDFNEPKMQFVAPSGSSIYGMYFTQTSPNLDYLYPYSALRTSFEINTGIENYGGQYFTTKYLGVLTTSSTAGTFKFQWALSRGTSTITIYKGSFLRLTKL